MPQLWLEMRCPACAWRELADTEGLLVWLRRAGMLRGNRRPDVEVIEELLPVALGKLTCPACRHTSLTAHRMEEDAQDDLWDVAITCTACGRPIPPERLEALPDTRICVACQSADEQGGLEGEDAWCPQCGGPMQWRVQHTGRTRYRLVCQRFPACRGEVSAGP